MSRAVIVGGGLAGATAALGLARLGRAAVLLERTVGPHDKMCGEFLSVEAAAGLTALGLDVRALGGTTIGTVRVMRGRRTVESRLPFVATGLTRRTLDEALLALATARGVTVERGVRVRSVGGGVVDTDRGEVQGDAVLLATGKHDLHGRRRVLAGRQASLADNIGFKMYFRATPALQRALADTVLIVVYEGGYAGVQLVDGRRVNLCLLVSPRRFAELGSSWEALVAALVAEPGLAMLADADPLLERPLSVSGVPYGYLATPDPADPVYRLGDQAGVIPSFCGDGMAMAVHSGRLAAEAVHDGMGAPAYQARLRRDLAGPVHLAARVQRLTQHPWGQFLLMVGLGVMPGLLPVLARRTRVGDGFDG